MLRFENVANPATAVICVVPPNVVFVGFVSIVIVIQPEPNAIYRLSFVRNRKGTCRRRRKPTGNWA